MSRHALFAAALLVAFLSLAGATDAQTIDRTQIAAEIEQLREQISVKEPLLLAPSHEDREAYAEFLAQPGRGLIRLLPREKWDGKLSMRGGGAYYSFTRLKHDYGYGSDIALEQNKLSVGFAGANFGFMLNLGNVPLENVSAENEALEYMFAFKTPSAITEARKCQRGFSDGHQAGQWIYKDRLPVAVNNTYALRSVNYGDADVLVVFRVVRKDADGSAVLVWKMLKEFPKPVLERNAVAAGQ